MPKSFYLSSGICNQGRSWILFALGQNVEGQEGDFSEPDKIKRTGFHIIYLSANPLVEPSSTLMLLSRQPH